MSIAITNNVGWKYLSRVGVPSGQHAAVTFLDQHRVQEIGFTASSATIPTGLHLGITVDVNDENWGRRKYMLLHNNTGGALTAGVSYTYGQVTVAAAAATAGSTTSLTDVGIAWVANEHVGRLLRIIDNADAAGAAPECETVPIIGNTVEILYVNPATPFSLAVAAADTYQIIAPFEIPAAAAAGDTKWDSIGVAMMDVPIAHYAWFCTEAELILHNCTTAAITQDLELEMAAVGELQNLNAAVLVCTACTATAIDAVLEECLARKYGY